MSASTCSTAPTSTPTARPRRSSAVSSPPCATTSCSPPRSGSRAAPGSTGAARRRPTSGCRSSSSLARLGTDRIDLYYLHRFDERTDIDHTLRTLDALVTAGKILHIGVSNFAAWQVATALGRSALNGWAPIVALQPMYNLVKRQAEVELLPLAQSADLAVFPYSPLAGGLLTGKYGTQPGSGEGRLVANQMYSIRYRDEAGYVAAAGLAALAAEIGCHPATLAVAWVGSHPGVTAPLIGGRTLEQLQPVARRRRLRARRRAAPPDHSVDAGSPAGHRPQRRSRRRLTTATSDGLCARRGPRADRRGGRSRLRRVRRQLLVGVRHRPSLPDRVLRRDGEGRMDRHRDPRGVRRRRARDHRGRARAQSHRGLGRRR